MSSETATPVPVEDVTVEIEWGVRWRRSDRVEPVASRWVADNIVRANLNSTHTCEVVSCTAYRTGWKPVES